MKLIGSYIALAFLLVSCGYFEKEPQEDVVARVNDDYLYESDIQKLVSENTSPEDSTLIVNNYITRWATQKLLIGQAKINLSGDQLDRFDRLVEEYKNDLLTDAYKNVIVGQQLDSAIGENEYKTYYEENIDNFKLNHSLLKMRFVQLPENYEGLKTVKEKFTRYDKKDKEALNGHTFQFISSNLNDSVWIKKEVLLDALPILKTAKDEVLKKSNFSQLQDSLGVYLVKIEDVLYPNDVAPLPYIKPTLKQIILNKRKLELIRKLETDITRDAIEHNKFEIYANE
ncbi:peptidyl-prolyl cis-trans isomerase [Aequorivita sp. H23M31]|uniref:Peptidyl-prolyl cis-trans isomerase n=1 Tax=Aequorivita ciconiae TaxID=2494375 RepID=A0A410G1J3_9FLAO|nr:peptidyl-prolyl cis-trans isomerase [Aequorivita sp. H23M31]QAA81132.1 peptidyl-prolyl cis-trans isomerase [Aequorivita sp. H23M31]